jgi:hypothetical protein
VVPDVALGVGSAVAGVDTVAVVASLSLRAVVICLTTNHNNRLCAGYSRIPEIAFGACADRFVFLHFAECICGARVCDSARV